MVAVAYVSSILLLLLLLDLKFLILWCLLIVNLFLRSNFSLVISSLGLLMVVSLSAVFILLISSVSRLTLLASLVSTLW